MNVKKFMYIFRCLDTAYGQYKSEGKNENGKLNGKAYTVKEPPTEELFKKHLEGKEPSLGIIPITQDNKCYWGCIDVDEYKLDHKTLLQKIRSLKIPIVMCRSKSGGAHLFLFVEKAVSAALMQKTLRGLAASFGFSSSEIFPKQIDISEGRYGNFLNLPYHGGDSSFRYAYKNDGSSATLEEFYKLYLKYVVKKSGLSKLNVDSKDDAIPDGPPCLQILCSQGFPEGERNMGLFNIGVYVKKAFKNNWKEKLEEYNRSYMSPPLMSQEVVKIQESLEKDYKYRCKDEPIRSFCNAQECRKRKWGIGIEYEREIGNLRKQTSDPPLWFLDVDGKTITLESDQFFTQPLFRRAVADKTNYYPPSRRGPAWDAFLQTLLDGVIEMEVPEDVNLKGQFKNYLKNFCTNIGMAMSREEILLEKPYLKDSKIYFRLTDLQKYLTKQSFTIFKTNKIASTLKEMGAKHVETSIKGESIRLWIIDEYKKNEEPINTPSIEKKEQPY